MIEVDLDLHGFFEASAGTGKTYVLEHLVLRLVRDKGVPLSRILVLTYTEKAAGEMGDRIRQRIATELEGRNGNDAVRRRLLQEAVDCFDEAPISTIHAFCARVIREFAGELRVPFELETGDDKAVFDRAFAQQVRCAWNGNASGDWPDRFQQEKQKLDQAQSLLLQVARQCRAHAGERILPDGDPTASTIPAFLSWAATGLAKAARQLREREFMLSYEDLLRLVWEGFGDDNSPLLHAIRSRYSHVFVDEFQDTDSVQWGIFKRAFLGSGDHKLFLVGDPKQAIYSFRGADLRAYCRARDEAADRGAISYPLNVNWRSVPDLLDAFNVLFDQSAGSCWFGPGMGIQYAPTVAPEEPLTRIVCDSTGRKAVTVVQLPKDGVARLRRDLAAWIAREIADNLLKDNALVYLRPGMGERALRPGDIAILVARTAEVPGLEAALAERGIRATFYKKSGLYASAQAIQMRALLDALADPEPERGLKRAILTPAFPRHFRDAIDSGAVDSGHPARRAFDRWRELEQERDWPRLFQGLMTGSGLLVREAAEPDGDRRVANWLQLCEMLELEADSGAGSAGQLAARLAALEQSGKAAGQDEQLHRQDTQESRVQIMTIHAAKGLQFPVVFVFGGLTHARWPAYHVFHDGKTIVYQLDKTNKPHKKAADQERDDEYRRVYYVALTRAMLKLYVPRRAATLARGPAAGPIHHLFDGCLGRLVQRPELCESVDVDAGVPAQADAGKAGQAEEESIQIPEPLLPDETRSYWPRRRSVVSFTAISSKAHAAGQAAGGAGHATRPEVSFESEERRPNDEEAATHEDETAEPAADACTLPHGARTGNVLHRVMEDLPFELAAAAPGWDAFRDDATVASIVASAMAAEGLREQAPDPEPDMSYASQIARLAYNALTTRLSTDLAGSFCLCDVKDRLTEVEFHLPVSPDQRDAKACSRSTTVKGFIDLVFRVQPPGCRDVPVYFLLDWKTNHLWGGYGRDSLAQAMEHHFYGLQHRLYTLALQRWLDHRTGGRFDPQSQWGGVFYLFVRGMRGGEHAEGVYHDRLPMTQAADEAEDVVRGKDR